MIDEITAEETAKIAGILETKWTRMVADKNKVDQELEAALVRADILQKDCDYWHERAVAAEARGDKHWAEMDFMLQQWNKLHAQCLEVRQTVKRGILPNQPEPVPPIADNSSVVVFNRTV